MKALIVSLLACVASIHAQQMPKLPPSGPMPNLPDDAVVAVFEDGAQLTMGEFRELARALPQQTANRYAFMQMYAMTRKMAKMAEKDKLDQRSPWKELLDYQRFAILAQAEADTTLNGMTVSPDAIAKYYEEHKDKYKEIKVKAIYIAFGDAQPEGKKALTEEQAKAKAEKLLAEIRGGADFVKLVKENSDDETSKAKDGDFPVIHPGDNIPDAMRAAVFALKEGEVSEPVRQANGYYLFRVEQISYRTLDQVRDQIFEQVRAEQFDNWMKQARANVKFPNPAFVGQGAPVSTPGAAAPADGGAAAAAAAARKPAKK